MIEKYIQTQDLVNRLTQDSMFKTFFTLYLMADNEVERNQLNTRFWHEVDNQSLEKRRAIEAEFTNCFKKLPVLISQLAEKASFAVA